MPKITYVAPDGTTYVHDVPVGQTVMRGAVLNEVPGILADCGGACACATCQVIVDQAWADKVAAPEAMERSMLEEEEGPPRRLSCQLTVTDALDGLVVHVVENLM